MIDKQQLTEVISAYLADTDYQLITLNVSPSDDILVEVDRFAGVDVDFCAELNHYLQSELDRLYGEDADYSLEVGSVSLTDPFKTLMQYQKNVGHDVEVLTKDGKKLHGVLVEAEEDHFAIDVEVMVAVEGKKRKQKEIQTLSFGYDAVKYTCYDLKV